jgi:hypothetical protein
LDLFVGAIEAFPGRDDHEGEQQPIEGADDAEGEAGDFVIAFEAFDRHQAPNDIEAENAQAGKNDDNERHLDPGRPEQKISHRGTPSHTPAASY